MTSASFRIAKNVSEVVVRILRERIEPQFNSERVKVPRPSRNRTVVDPARQQCTLPEKQKIVNNGERIRRLRTRAPSSVSETTSTNHLTPLEMKKKKRKQ